MKIPNTAAETGSPVLHPLLRELTETLDGGGAGLRILLIGIGSGRHIPHLLEQGRYLDALENDPARAAAAALRFRGEKRLRIARWPYTAPYPFRGGYAAALSTHALLHGMPEEIGAAVRQVRARLSPRTTFYATLGSQNDPRFRTGRRLGPITFAAEDGSERGLAHSYFDPAGVRRIFAEFDLDCSETGAAESAGVWAHTTAEAETLVHWFARARTTSRPPSNTLYRQMNDARP